MRFLPNSFYVGEFQDDKIQGRGRLGIGFPEYGVDPTLLGMCDYPEQINLLNEIFRERYIYFDSNGTDLRNLWVVYIGEVKNCKAEGKGELHFACRSFYKGNFRNDKIHGDGTLHVRDGSVYELHFEESKITNKYRIN